MLLRLFTICRICTVQIPDDGELMLTSSQLRIRWCPYFVLVAWNWLCWEYLYHGNWQILQFFFSPKREIVNIYQPISVYLPCTSLCLELWFFPLLSSVSWFSLIIQNLYWFMKIQLNLPFPHDMFPNRTHFHWSVFCPNLHPSYPEPFDLALNSMLSITQF